MKKARMTICIAAAVSVLFAASAPGAGVVPPGTSVLADSASASNPAVWWFDGDYISPSDSVFSIGTWNQLIIDNGHTFTASDGLTVGRSNASNSLLHIQDGTVIVNGNALCGQSTSVAHNSQNHRIVVAGPDARLEVTGNLHIGSGGAWLVINNTLNISDNAVVIVDSDKDGTGNFSARNHWSYGNSWLELNGGLLAIWGDKTVNFVDGAGLLTSIKVWDEISESFQRVAYYEGQTWTATDYRDWLSVAYIDDVDQAAAMGLSDEFVGFTVVQNIPEPAGLVLLGLGGLVLRRRK